MVTKTLPPLVGVTLHFHLHPIARYPLNLLFAARLPGRSTFDVHGVSSALEDGAPLVG